MESQHIALFAKHLSVGGLEKITVRLANEFARRGHTVDLVLAKGRGPLESEVASDVQIVALRSHRMWGALPNLLRYLKRSQPDVLLAAGWQVNVIAIWTKMLSLTSFRLVVSVHTNATRQSEISNAWYARFSLPAIKVFYPFADAIIAVSKGVLEDLSGISSRAAENGHVIYNPTVDQDLFKKAHQELSHPWFTEKNDVPVLLGVGRMGSQKNFSLLIRAFAQLCRHREARLVLLGDGDERRALEALTHVLNVQDSVEFVGFEENPYKYMARADVFVLSSRSEGLPTVLIEALACGCPIVSTDSSEGVREILGNGEFGTLVPVGDREALADAITIGLTHDSSPVRLRRRANDFKIQNAVKEYLSLFGFDDAESKYRINT